MILGKHYVRETIIKDKLKVGLELPLWKTGYLF